MRHGKQQPVPAPVSLGSRIEGGALWGFVLAVVVLLVLGQSRVQVTRWETVQWLVGVSVANTALTLAFYARRGR